MLRSSIFSRRELVRLILGVIISRLRSRIHRRSLCDDEARRRDRSAAATNHSGSVNERASERTSGILRVRSRRTLRHRRARQSNKVASRRFAARGRGGLLAADVDAVGANLRSRLVVGRDGFRDDATEREGTRGMKKQDGWGVRLTLSAERST
jgi:hypothetical protein